MKCPKCQAEMIQAKGSWLCMECGHLESVAPNSVPLIHEDNAAEATIVGNMVAPVAAEASAPNPSPEAAVKSVPDVTPVVTPAPKHTIDHAAQAAKSTSHAVKPKPAKKEKTVFESLPKAETEPETETATASESKPVADSKLTTDNSPRAIDGPSRVAPVSAAELHPTPVVKTQPKSESIPTSGTTIETITTPTPSPVASPDPEPTAQAIAQTAPAPTAEIPAIAPVTHPRPVNKRLMINIIVLFVALVAAAGIIYAYFQGIDPSLLIPKK